MSHPLLQFLLTPMAPPETTGLKRLRRSWVLLCACLAVSAPLNSASVALFGPRGALPALLLLLAAPAMGIVYFRAKASAEDAQNRGEKP